MNPFDVVSTRLYNQTGTFRACWYRDGRCRLNGHAFTGRLYSSVFDCLWKTVTTEGVSALWKGWGAQYLR
jgi:hypothetical protein